MEKIKQLEIAQRLFNDLTQKYTLEEISCLSIEIGNLMWKKRVEQQIEKLKSQRKGAILQHVSGSYELGGERVKLLRKGQKRATIKVMTGKQKGRIWLVPYHNLTINLSDVIEARKRSQMAKNMRNALGKILS